MTIARREIAPDGAVGVYHCMSRCVRRAYLCGRDPHSGRSYEHRRNWVRQRLKFLARFFGVEICAYAVMSNHTHVVLRTRPDLAESWSADEAARRWLSIFSRARDRNGRPKAPAEARIKALTSDEERLLEIRRRLTSISWFMRCLNEHIARRANREDECTGRFWEGRFKCQSLLDESAIMACMAYVDLNPVRSGLADLPETSEFTSVYDRITGRRNRELHVSPVNVEKDWPDSWLSPLADASGQKGAKTFLPMTEDEYLRLIDWTSRLLVAGKKPVPDQIDPLLTRLQIETDRWLMAVGSFGNLFQRVAGRCEAIRRAARASGRKWLKGIGAGRLVFG